MVEELPEQGEPGVEAGGQALVRRGVGDEQRLTGRDWNAAEIEQYAVRIQRAQASIDIGLHRRRVADGLVDDQVGDDPRVGIHDAAKLAIGSRPIVVVVEDRRRSERTIRVEAVAVLVVAEVLIQHLRERLVCRAVVLLSTHQVVEGAVHGTQTEGHPRVGQDVQQVFAVGMPLGDLDLVEDELQVAADQVQAAVQRDDRVLLRQYYLLGWRCGPLYWLGRQ
ncbi:hypothetical protein D9M68_228430 [compost metagenome]